MEIRLGYIEQFEEGYTTCLDKGLTQIDFENYLKASSELNNYDNLKRLFEILTLNYNEFIEFTQSESRILFENSLSPSGDNKNYYKHHLNLNRIFLNYLSSFRTLIDHIETTIKRKYGNESDEVIKYKKLTTYLFDNFFSYRFLGKLRNYSQHCGLPIDEFEISATKISEDKFKSEYKIEFSTEKLLRDYTSWGKVKNDLLKQNYISIFTILEEMNLALDLFWTKLILIFEKDLNSAISYIVDNAGYLKNKNTNVCIFTDITTDENKALKYYTSHTLPFETIETIMNNKNCT